MTTQGSTFYNAEWAVMDVEEEKKRKAEEKENGESKKEKPPTLAKKTKKSKDLVESKSDSDSDGK